MNLEDAARIVKSLPLRDKLEQLAEESAELSQAALKLIRASGETENPTPIGLNEARLALSEERSDVQNALFALGVSAYVGDIVKIVRWAERIQAKRDETHK